MNRWKKVSISIIEMLVVGVVTVGIFRFVVIPVRIDGSSMANTLHDQDIAFVNAIGVNEKNMRRFQVVVAYSEELNEKIIKRVIGLPGETITFENDVLYVNGKEIKQDFLDQQFVEESCITYNTKLFTENFEISLGEDEYFLMGDNRLASTDSRVLGPFSLDDIIGSQGVVVYPFSHIQWLV